MCNNFSVSFIDANIWMRRRHLARDGKHLNGVGFGHFAVFISSRLGEACGDVQEPLDGQVIVGAEESPALPLAKASVTQVQSSGNVRSRQRPSRG